MTLPPRLWFAVLASLVGELQALGSKLYAVALQAADVSQAPPSLRLELALLSDPRAEAATLVGLFFSTLPRMASEYPEGLPNGASPLTQAMAACFGPGTAHPQFRASSAAEVAPRQKSHWAGSAGQPTPIRDCGVPRTWWESRRRASRPSSHCRSSQFHGTGPCRPPLAPWKRLRGTEKPAPRR